MISCLLQDTSFDLFDFTGRVCVSNDDIMDAVERAKLSFDNRQQHQEFSEQDALSRLFAQARFDF